MKTITLATLGLLISLTSSAHYQWASFSNKNAICQEMRMNKHTTSARKCYEMIRRKKFDDQALDVCNEIAMNLHSQSALKCLNIISNKHFRVIDSKNCLGFAIIKKTESALLCLNHLKSHY